MLVVAVALVLAVGLAPLWLVVMLVADAVVDWKRHQFLRVYLMITALLLNEAFGLITIFVAWVASGFGLFTHREWSYRLLGMIHGQWTHNIARATEVFFDAEFDIVGAELVEPAPVIILQRHISLLDAILPSKFISYRRNNAPRHVLMRELRFDPCIETIGHRTPNHFVDRAAGGAKELAAIEAVGRTLGPHGSGVIFPEGGFRTEARYERAVESLDKKDPELGERARRLRHVMPPRPGGTRALLDGAPGVDVIVVAHAGYEGFSTIKDIITNAPISGKISVELKRIARSEIPEDEAEFNQWLFDQYDWIDAFVERHVGDCADQPTVDVTGLDITSSTPADIDLEALAGEPAEMPELRGGRESVA